jgi:hypothetical protein
VWDDGRYLAAASRLPAPSGNAVTGADTPIKQGPLGGRNSTADPCSTFVNLCMITSVVGRKASIAGQILP